MAIFSHAMARNLKLMKVFRCLFPHTIHVYVQKKMCQKGLFATKTKTTDQIGYWLMNQFCSALWQNKYNFK